MKIDQIDLLLLYYLKNDSRITYSELSNKVNLTSPAVKYRINNLIKNRIIEAFTIKINYQKLTPNYQSYIIEAQVMPSQIDNFYNKISSTNLVNNFFKLASSKNVVFSTVPLSNENIRFLTEVLGDQNTLSFSITPIVDEKFDIQSKRFSAEKIDNLYCSECQDVINFQDGFLELIDNKILGFCCNKCMKQFNEKYDDILSKA